MNFKNEIGWVVKSLRGTKVRSLPSQISLDGNLQLCHCQFVIYFHSQSRKIVTAEGLELKEDAQGDNAVKIFLAFVILTLSNHWNENRIISQLYTEKAGKVFFPTFRHEHKPPTRRDEICHFNESFYSSALYK